MSTMLTVLSGSGQVVFNTADALYFGNFLASQLNSSAVSGVTTPLVYTGASGSSAPAPSSGIGVVLFATSPTVPVVVPTTDSVIVDASSGPVSISGGAPGASVLAGSGGLNYTNITPGGTAADPTEIATGDGVNSISTSTAGGGAYYVATGAGNDSIGIYTGVATVGAGEGHNVIAVGGGATPVSAVIYSNGYDTIVGNVDALGTAGAGGTVAVIVQAGQDTINPGSSNFSIDDSSANALVLLAGTGSDTVSVSGGAGPATVASGSGNVGLMLTGAGSITATAGTGNVTVTAVGTLGPVSVTAGLGNDTLLAGSGADTLAAGIGSLAATSGVSGSTTFQFTGGSSMGSDTVYGFKSTDFLQLLGYGLSSAQVATATSVGISSVVNGSTVVALAGGTTIILNGVTSLASSQVKTS